MKIAVVGSGISGLGSAWLLSRGHEVHLFEADSRLGGHANTAIVTENEKNVPMDTGFLVYNELTYPNLTAFFRELQVETVDSNMSLSVQVPEKNLEWSGTSLNTIFAQRRNLININFYTLLAEIMRFGREATENRQLAARHGWSLAELLREKKYSANFRSDYLLPIGAAIWSTPEARMLDFPAETFITFFINHKLLQVADRPVWRTVKNGSVQYVNRVAATLNNIHLNSAVKEVERADGKIIVRTENDSATFDKVVLATHAPVTKKILKNQTEKEARVLSAILYEPNRTLLHTDETVMPKTKISWSSWNVKGSLTPENVKKVSLSYFLNLLQPLQTDRKYFVTLNSPRKVAGVINEYLYEHPQFDKPAIQAQRELPDIQGNGGVYFAGAWSRFGFHEDGLLSAVNVSKLIGVAPPW